MPVLGLTIKIISMQDKFYQKHANIFGNEKYKDFACIETMLQETEQTFNKKLLALDPNN